MADQPTTVRTARLISLMAAASAVFILIYSAFWVAIQPRYAGNLVYSLIALSVIGLTFILIYLRRVRLSGFILIAGLWTVVTIGLLRSGGTRAPFFSFYILIVLLAALLFRWRAVLGFAILSITAGLIMVLLNSQGAIQPPFATPASSWLTQAAILVLLTIAGYFVFRRRDQVIQQAWIELVERQNAEAALRASEERFRLISAVMSDYTFSSYFNAEGKLEHTLLAGAFEAITGYTAEEFVALGGWRATVHPDDVEQDERDMAMLNQNQRVVTELRIVKKTGEVRWVRVYGHPIWDEDNNRLAGVNGAVQDITDRKLAEQALRESENRYRVISEMISDYAYAYDIRPDGSFTPAWITDDSFTRLTGYKWDEIGSKFNLYHPDDAETGAPARRADGTG